jgi:Helix-turn-helix domain
MSAIAAFTPSAIPPSPAPSSPLFNERQAATYLHPDMNHRTLERWRRTGEGPAFIKIGRRVAYRQVDLDDWIAWQRREHTRDRGRR